MEINSLADLDKVVGNNKNPIIGQSSLGNNKDENEPHTGGPHGNRTMVDALRDMLGGVAHGSQHLAAGILEGGEYIGRKAVEKELEKKLGHPVNLPKWNAREFAGLEGENQVDLGKMIASKNPDPVAFGLGQYGLSMGGGGASLARQAATQGAYGASQASPEQENGFGLLPEGRMGAAIQDAGSIYGLGKAIKAIPPIWNAGKKAIDYLHPEKEAEKFRSTLGQGTSSENIENIGKRVEFGRKSAEEQSFIPKEKIYSQEGKSRIYETKPESLPESNLPKLAHMVEPHGKFTENQMGALSKAISEYRNFKPEYKINAQGKRIQTNKGDDIEPFLEKAEDIFNVPELPKNAALKIQDALQMPVKRDSKYFSNPEVTKFYNDVGLTTMHKKYAKNPTLNNYDELQSAIKEKMRKLPNDTPGGVIKEGLSQNIKNLNADTKQFMKTLPKEMQNLEKEFRTKYRENVVPYFSKESHPAIQKLSEGKWNEVSPSELADAFTYQNKATLKVLEDLGPSASKNILYNAVQKVKPNDAKGLAETILDLKRTKGYDRFVTKDMEKWADNMLRHIALAGGIKKGMGALGGAAIGGALGGPLGAAVGATTPWAIKGGKYLAEKLRK